MKKVLILTAVFFLLGDFLFSQTYTVRVDENWDLEWSVITKEAWNRLLEQKEAQYNYALLYFIDVVENPFSGQVIRGSRPSFSGYYYLLGTYIPRSDEAKTAVNLVGATVGLGYGNRKTGFFGIRFYNSYGYLIDGAYSIGSDSYNRRYNQCIRWVNGE